MDAAETNVATTASFLQHLGMVFGFFSVKLRDAATYLACGLLGGPFGTRQEKEAAAAAAAAAAVDLEANLSNDEETGPPAVAEAEKETNVIRFLETNFSRAGGRSTGEIALVILSTFPSTFLFTLPGLLTLAQIKGQLAPFGPTLHKWYIVCVTSLLTEFVASLAQWIVFAAAHGNPTTVYNVIFRLGRVACFLGFLVSLAVLLYS